MSQEARQEGTALNRGNLLWARKGMQDFEGRAATAVTVHLEHRPCLWVQDRQKSLLLSRNLYQQKVATCTCFHADEVFEMKTIAFRKRYVLPLKTPEKIPWLDILSWGGLTCL